MEKLITTKELAALLQVDITTIWRWRKKGLPVKKIGGAVRFDVTDVNQWIEAQNK